MINPDLTIASILALVSFAVLVFLVFQGHRLQNQHRGHLVFMLMFFFALAVEQINNQLGILAYQERIEWVCVVAGIAWLSYLCWFLYDQAQKPTKKEYEMEQTLISKKIQDIEDKL